MKQAHPHTLPAAPVAKNNGLAIASLVCGLCSFFLSILTGIPAIILGIIALVKIRKSNGTQTGSGMAVTGIVTGSIGAVIIASLVAISAPAVKKQLEKANITYNSTQAKQAYFQLAEYETQHGQYPDTFTLDWKHPRSNELKPWIYHGKGHSAASPSHHYLLSSPESHKGARQVLFMDGSVKSVSEGSYQMQLTTQP